MNELAVALCTTQKRIGQEANFNWLWQFKLHYDEYSDDENGNDDEDGDNDGGDGYGAYNLNDCGGQVVNHQMLGNDCFKKTMVMMNW